MCLMTIKSVKEKKEFIDSIPAIKGLKVYRIIRKYHDEDNKMLRYVPVFHHIRLKEGLNRANTERTLGTESAVEKTYESGFHSFLRKEDADIYIEDTFCREEAKVVECIVKKAWVTTLGQNPTLLDNGQLMDCVVSSKIFIPKLDF